MAILSGIFLGNLIPALFSFAASLEWAHINLPIAILIWIMIYPMMVQVDLATFKDLSKKPKGIILTLIINWLIKPFSMAALGWLFFRVIFSGWVPTDTATEYIAGMILLGVAPCTAMVFVWSHLTNGDPNYTLLQISINDVIMVFAFAPIAAFLLGVSNIHVPWDTLIISVVLYVLLPLLAGIATRKIFFSNRDPDRLNDFLVRLKPLSVIGLLLTVFLLFGLQAQTILDSPQIIALIAAPLIIQSYGIFFIAFAGARLLKLPYNIAAPACLIGTSNFFELAVAVAISLFGLHSGAALATVVGVLVEVPVMLSLVSFCKHYQHLFDAPENSRHDN
ncbi:MAG: ACR3 family arsenite efflux transporter [Sneathiella sp.]|nr:ACR3 family arsenite efflux transporter [Sneathiella sp.]